MASVKEAFPKEAFIEASRNQDYATAIQIIDKHGVVVSNCCNVFDLIKTQKNQSLYLINTIFNKLDVATLSSESFVIICNNPVMLKSLLLLRNDLKNTDRINKHLYNAVWNTRDEECIMMLSTTEFRERIYFTYVKSRDNHIKLIKLLGFKSAAKYDMFKDYLREYYTLIEDEKWNCELIEYADPFWSYVDSAFSLAIDRGRHDYISKLIDIAGDNDRIKKIRHNAKRFSREYDILTYSIVQNKFKCTEVILSKLGDISRKITYNNEDLDVFEYCMMVNDIRTLKLFANTNHRTYSTGLNSIDISRFIIRFDPVRRYSMWILIREKYIRDRALCGEPLTEDENQVDKLLLAIIDKLEDMDIKLQSYKRRELQDIVE